MLPGQASCKTSRSLTDILLKLSKFLAVLRSRIIMVEQEHDAALALHPYVPHVGTDLNDVF
jgi:hypothetical protein